MIYTGQSSTATSLFVCDRLFICTGQSSAARQLFVYDRVVHLWTIICKGKSSAAT